MFAAPGSPPPPTAWNVTAWDAAKWQSQRDLLARLAKLLQLDVVQLLAEFLQLDLDKLLDGVPTLAMALRRLEAARVLSSVFVDYLIELDEQEARRRKARHTGRRSTTLERVARVLRAACADPASGVTFEAVKAELNQSLYYRLEDLLKDQGVENPNRTTMRRAIAALDSGRFGGPPP